MFFRAFASLTKYSSRTLNRVIQYQTIHVRFKNIQYTGVKGIRNRKSMFETGKDEGLDDFSNQEVDEISNLESREYDEVAKAAMHVSRDSSIEQNVLIIQPFIKWEPNKKQSVTPESQLKEAEALIRSLPNWNVALSIKVPLESFGKKSLFGTGKLEELKAIVSDQRQFGNKSLTCLFVSKSTLSFAQKRILESEFGIPVMDRYSVVIQILRLHATSAEAKIQVAMAEIPYIWTQMKDENISKTRRVGYFLSDTQREILKTRERKLKQELEKIRDQRQLLRKKRKLKDYPTVAVVGYTNAGKTSLIKILTDESEMQPRDQLFATLDVTAHGGILPCNLNVIYMDTVGFMSDLPTGLLECFISTLEDAMLADIIIHVQDLSHENVNDQKCHVENTLESLALNIQKTDKLPPIINVGNKIDLLPAEEMDKLNQTESKLKLVSSTTRAGLSELIAEIEKKILENTSRQNLTIRVRNGGREMAWLFKNAAVVNSRADEKDAESILIDVVITKSKMQQFKHYFCQK